MAFKAVSKQLAEPEDDGQHPTQATGGCTRDEVLRAKGFRILSRPANSEPRWMRRGVVFTQSQAEKLAGIIP